MANLAQAYDRIGVRRNAPVSAVYDAYNHWRTYIRPLLEVEASYTYSRNERHDRQKLIVDMEDDFHALLCSNAPAPKRARRASARSRAH